MSRKTGSISIREKKKTKGRVFTDSTGMSGIACYIFCSAGLCLCHQYIRFRCDH